MKLEDHSRVGKWLLFLATFLVFPSSCAHVIEKNILHQVNTEITFAELRKAPHAYQGELVLLGGVIVNTVNKKEGTLLEVYQTELTRRGKPKKLDVSRGRFVALYQGFLDNAIFHRGRKVTIAGIVQGEEIMRIGDIDYHYPYLIIKEIYLWEKEYPPRYAPYPPPLYPWGHPYHPWHIP
jgi:outer membrane lipoprotein